METASLKRLRQVDLCMGVAKLSIYNDDYIGAFAVSTDAYTLVGGRLPHKDAETIEEIIGTTIVRLTISGSDLVGLYVAANSKAILLPNMTYNDEINMIKHMLPDLSVHVLDTDLNALRNNILANDSIAVINPSYSHREASKIEDNLDVEVIKMAIGGFDTVGANNILTNKGLVLNNLVSEEDEGMLREIVGNSISQSTANLGALSIGLCTIANSKGLLIGRQTTGYEISNIMDGLSL